MLCRAARASAGLLSGERHSETDRGAHAVAPQVRTAGPRVRVCLLQQHLQDHAVLLRRLDAPSPRDPDSVLWLFRDNNWAEENLRNEAQARGISAERLIFSARIALPEHLARHRLADLFLDTRPCNAHTTASDALWAGLPIVTCAGRSFPARVAGSLLHAIGLPELVTTELADYEALALELARKPEMLASLRRRLRDNRTTAPLFDSDRHRRHIEAAYREMVRLWQGGEPPRAIAVPEIPA